VQKKVQAFLHNPAGGSLQIFLGRDTAVFQRAGRKLPFLKSTA